MAEAGNEETPVTGRKEEEVVRLSNTLRGAAAIVKSELVSMGHNPCLGILPNDTPGEVAG